MWAHGSGDPKSEGLTRIAGMRSGNPSSLNVVNFRPSRRSTDTGPMRESDGAGSITRTVRSSENGPDETSQGSHMLAPADSSMVISFRRRMSP